MQYFVISYSFILKNMFVFILKNMLNEYVPFYSD